MQGHLIFEIGNKRFVGLPRDHRAGIKCGGCAFFCQRLGEPKTCPVDAAGNLVCRLGHGWTWKRIAWPKTNHDAAEDLATKNTKSTNGVSA